MPRKGSASKRPWVDPDDAPELTDDFFARAEVREHGKLVRPAKGALTRPRGRPKLESPKEMLSFRSDADVVARVRKDPDLKKRAIKAFERVVRRSA